MFKNKMLRRIFGLKKEEVIGRWRELHKVELHNLYALPNISGENKSRRMRQVGYIACLFTQ
jgi:hypothetical protein